MDEEEKAAQEAAAREAAEKAARDAEAAAREKAEADAADAAKKSAASDEAAALQAKIDELTAQVAKFEGLDPEAAREALRLKEEAEAAARDAEKERAKAEGNFEKLREIQNAEAKAAIDAAEAKAAEAQRIADEAVQKLNSSHIVTAFATSDFISKETILSGAKAQRLFGDHVEYEDGQVVVYDKPADAAKRARIMDSKGNPLPFNDAIAKVINSDPDKDTLLKSKVKPGAGSKTVDGKSSTDSDRHTRIREGLKSLRGA